MAIDGGQLDKRRLIRETFVAAVEHHWTIASTNDRAKQLAAAGTSPLPALVVADQQTAGRGRGANRWWTGQGSLAMSLALDAGIAGIERVRSPLVAMAAAVAVTQTVAARLPAMTVGVHWPNDVYVQGRKLAGVLVEVPSATHCILGIGVNTNNTISAGPTEIQDRAVSLRDLTGNRYEHTEFLIDLLGRLEPRLRQVAQSPHAVGHLANKLCLQRGQTLTIDVAEQTLTGRCAGIAHDGALLIDTADGCSAFYSGVVRVRKRDV
jgi:BirA family biotin operon repressor/biotin-[acetyl-CoA-carboxylase] ligase